MSAPDPRAFWRRHLVRPALLVLGLNAAAFAAYTLPALLEERSQQAQMATLRREVERERRTLAERRARAAAVEANARDLERFYRELPSDPGAGTLGVLKELDAVSAELGLPAPSQSFDRAPVRDAPVTRLAVTMPLSGSYASLAAFLGRIEASKRFLTVDEVRMQEGERGGRLDVTLSAYFLTRGGRARS